MMSNVQGMMKGSERREMAKWPSIVLAEYSPAEGVPRRPPVCLLVVSINSPCLDIVAVTVIRQVMAYLRLGTIVDILSRSRCSDYESAGVHLAWAKPLAVGGTR